MRNSLVPVTPDFSEAKCIGSGDIFFPEIKSESSWEIRSLKFICDTCVYSQGDNPCLTYGKSIGASGFWGGKLL